MSTRGQTFQHEALLYADQDEFLAGTTSFLREALEADEPALVVVDAAKVALLRAELGTDAGRIEFADMAGAGANPARIIPVWREFVDRHGAPDRGIWGIGEPIWPGRSAAELAECHRHEALLNIAFADSPGFRLLCPYDTVRLDDEVLHGARCSHPVMAVSDGKRSASRVYSGLDAIAEPFDEPLPEPPVTSRELPYERDTLRLVRRFVAAHAVDAGLRGDRVDDLVLAIDELASNSVRYGGGTGVLRVWQDDGALLCEVRDGGLIDDPMVGRVRPSGERIGGYGMWMVNQLCDLVQVRTSGAGTVVRVHTRLSGTI
jgi:anti-sigma regulatory factor (Ser/Thr protein kinase)